jgi:hypothetical protein
LARAQRPARIDVLDEEIFVERSDFFNGIE